MIMHAAFAHVQNITCITHVHISLSLRMRRWCQPPNGSEPKASKQVLELWKTEEGRSLSNCVAHTYPMTAAKVSGEKLKKLLAEKGSMKNIEMAITKWSKKSAGQGKHGKWVTRGQLKEQHHYTETLRCY